MNSRTNAGKEKSQAIRSSLPISWKRQSSQKRKSRTKSKISSKRMVRLENLNPKLFSLHRRAFTPAQSSGRSVRPRVKKFTLYHLRGYLPPYRFAIPAHCLRLVVYLEFVIWDLLFVPCKYYRRHLTLYAIYTSMIIVLMYFKGT